MCVARRFRQKIDFWSIDKPVFIQNDLTSSNDFFRQMRKPAEPSRRSRTHTGAHKSRTFEATKIKEDF